MMNVSRYMPMNYFGSGPECEIIEPFIYFFVIKKRIIVVLFKFCSFRCPLQTVICYIEVPSTDSDLLYRGVLYRQ